MALIASDNRKVFEKPESGQFLGVLADVVDLGIQTGKFGPKAKTRLVWLLAKADGTSWAVDSEGSPFRVMSEYNLTMNEKSDLFKTVKSILGVPPPAGPYDVEQLIGRNNLLFIVREKNQDGTKEYANVKGILPWTGVTLAIPPTFKRYTPKTDGASTTSAPATQAAPFVPATAAVAVVSTQSVPVQQAAPVAAPVAFQPAPAPQAAIVLDSNF